MSNKKIIKKLVKALKKSEAALDENIRVWEGLGRGWKEETRRERKVLKEIRRAAVLGRAAA